MPKLTVHDRKGNKVGTYNVEVEDFAPSINKQLLHDVVLMHLAARRVGTVNLPGGPRGGSLDHTDKSGET